MAKLAQPGVLFDQTAIFTNQLRKCPGGSYSAPPFSKGSWNPNLWNCWIGANFGAFGNPLTGPFYYGNTGTRPLNVSAIKKPADALMFMDTITHYVYSPVDTDNGYNFTDDRDGDGAVDSMSRYPDTPYNYARPTVHNTGANVALLDGHVERVPFKRLWQVDASRKVVHSFWYMTD